jgi:hypothetical protein
MTRQAIVTKRRSSVSSRGARSRCCWPSLCLAIVVPVSLLDAAASATLFLAQSDTGSGVRSLTMVVAIAVLAEAGGSLLAARWNAAARQLSMLLALGGVAAAVAFIIPGAFLPVVVVLAFLDGAAHPLRAAMIQQRATDTVRARAASIASACDKALSAVALVVSGSFR